MRKLSSTEERLIEIQTKLGKWNDFVRTLQVPADIVPAIASGRLELLRLAQPRSLTTEECAVVYQLISGLLETNQALQQHASLISNMAGEAYHGISGALGMVDRLSAYADYRSPSEEEL